jgi:hypothetical protein
MPSVQVAGKPTYIHATAVKIGEAGVLIRGPSRAGKSSLALALLAEAARLSWYGRLIGDDRIGIERCGASLILRGHPAILGKIERRGEGILDVAWEPSGIAHYVIDLLPEKFDAVFEAYMTLLENLPVPLFRLPHGPSAMERATLVMRLLQETKGSPLL